MPSSAEDLEPKKAASLYKTWMDEISDAQKREKKYRLIGREVVALYEAKKPEETPFAILYSNTEVLIPAVYNARPIPMVSRRYKDADPAGKAMAETSTRILKFMIDTESPDYDTFDDVISGAVLDGLLCNRGLSRFRYVAQEKRLPECVYGEAVRWDKFFHGYARTWKKVPWIGFEWDMSKDELKKNFPKAKLADLRMTSGGETDEDRDGDDKDEMAGVKTYKVYEIWDKISKKVMFFSPICPEAPLRYIDDPLELSSFFPMPKPINFMRKVTTLVPTPLYQQYRQQAAELNDLTKRLKAIIRAIKYRGAYNSTVEGIEKMLGAGDNELIPVENMQSMPDNTGMDKLLYIVPVQELAETARSLYQQRESVKQVIYEITGISDILRGASVASETATAQNIKNQWGTLRLKKMQKEVQRYCRDSLAIMLEIAAARFEISTMKAMTGLPFFSAEEKQQVGAKIQQQQQMAQMQAMVPPQPGAPPPPPPPPIPAEVQQLMAAPTWEDIQQLMQNDVTMHYKTDIETNSTIDAEAAQDKADIAELMNAISQFLNGVAPLVENGTMPMEVAKSMLLMISRRFNFGSQLEDALNQMKSPEPKTDPAQAEKAEAAKVEAQVTAAEGQQKMAAMKMEGQLATEKFQQEKGLMQLEMQIKREELLIKQQELALQRQGLGMKLQLQEATHKMKMEAAAAKPKEKENASV